MELLPQQTSSIGAVWPPEPTSQARIRGFYTEGVITGQAEADRLAEHVNVAIEQMSINNTVSRMSMRVVAELGLLARLTFNGLVDIEAVLPIAGTDMGIACIGKNASSRQVEPAFATAHVNLLRSVLSSEPKAARKGLDIRVVDPGQAVHLTEAFTPLYGVFGYDSQATQELLASTTNTIVYAVADDRVVSTAMAERGTVPVGGFGNLTMVEITEASTLEAYRGNGLYRAVSGHLIRHLLQARQEDRRSADVIYGESNLAMSRVVGAAHANGRRFSYLDRDTYGIANPMFGILPQNFSVNDGIESRNYNDFAVSYVPLEEGADYAS